MSFTYRPVSRPTQSTSRSLASSSASSSTSSSTSSLHTTSRTFKPTMRSPSSTSSSSSPSSVRRIGPLPSSETKRTSSVPPSTRLARSSSTSSTPRPPSRPLTPTSSLASNVMTRSTSIEPNCLPNSRDPGSPKPSMVEPQEPLTSSIKFTESLQASKDQEIGDLKLKLLELGQKNTSLQRQLDTLTPPLCSQVVSPPTPLSTPSITPSEPSEDAFTSMIKLQRYEERIQQLEKKLNFCQAVSKANEAAAKDSIHFSHLEALKNSHTAYVERLKITHQKALEELRQQHRDELSKIKFIYKSHPSMDPKKEARVVSSSTKSHPEEVSGTSSAETSDTYEEALQLVHEMYQLKLETFQKEKDTELAMLKNQLEEIQSSLDTPLVKSAPDHAHDNQENALLDREKAELLVQIELLTMEQRHLQGWRAEHETLYREEVEAHKKLQMEFQSLKETHGKDRREWQQHVRQLQVDLDQERQVHIQTQRALQHLESTRCELQVQLETLQREMVCKEVAYDQEKETWKVTLDEAERQMCAHTETIEAWKARYHGLESTNACLEQSLLSMEPSLKALQKKNEDLQNAQASLTEKNMDLVSKLCESSSMSHLVDSLKLQNQQLIAALKKYGISFSFENKNDTCVASTIA